MSSRVVFMGSPEFAVPSLRALVEAKYEVVLVVTQPDRPAGRGGKVQPPPVKVAAQSAGIPVFQPETMRDESVHQRLRDARADLHVVAAYGRILPQAVLDIPRRGTLNVHASLLPKWRGPSPIVAAIRAGDQETGVSIMELVRKMDAGPVLSRLVVPIGPADTAGTLEPRLAEAGAGELVRVLPSWLDGSITPEPQDEALATYCHIISKQDGRLRREMTAIEAECAVRAYNPWPGASVEYKGVRLSVWRARAIESEPGEPGSLALKDRVPALAFASGWLALEEVQRPGGKRLAAQQFLAGERGDLPPTVGLE